MSRQALNYPFPPDTEIDGSLKRLIEKDSDAKLQELGFDPTKREMFRGMPMGNRSRSWYAVIRMDARDRVTINSTPDDSFITCKIQLIIEWVLGGRVPAWVLRGYGLQANLTFLQRLAAAMGLLGEDVFREQLNRYIGGW